MTNSAQRSVSRSFFVTLALVCTTAVISTTVASAEVKPPSVKLQTVHVERTRQPIIVLGEPEIIDVGAGSKPKRAVKAAPKAEPAPEVKPKQWVCSGWEDLWQGSGKGRTCEWR